MGISSDTTPDSGDAGSARMKTPAAVAFAIPNAGAAGGRQNTSVPSMDAGNTSLKDLAACGTLRWENMS